MRRFDYDDNEEYREDVDNFFNNGDGEQGITPEEYRAIVKEEQQMQQTHLALVNRDLNSRLMTKAIRMLESSFWWRFYSLDTRLKMIERTFFRLKRATERE